MSKKRDAARKGMIEALEDEADAEAARVVLDRIASGEEELIPSEFVERLINGENTVRVWREFRGLSMGDLAEKAGISASVLSQIENGERHGDSETIERIANALNLDVDDIA